MSSNWYGTQRWRRRARAQLREHPLCASCLQLGKVVPATVADHIVPHRGDERLFHEGALQSLCAYHHSGTKQQREVRGYATDIGLDGYPLDPMHPFYQRERTRGRT
jgi:5-methylcytosine-specific restriction protein A